MRVLCVLKGSASASAQWHVDTTANAETIQQSWFDTSVLKKQISSFFSNGNINTADAVSSPEEEDNRNDCHAEVNPVLLNNEEVRQEMVRELNSEDSVFTIPPE